MIHYPLRSGALTCVWQGSHGNAQLLYELTFCIWTLSFHESVGDHTTRAHPFACAAPWLPFPLLPPRAGQLVQMPWMSLMTA